MLFILVFLTGVNGKVMMKSVGEEVRYPIKCPSNLLCDVLFSSATEGREEKVYDGTDRIGFPGYRTDDREHLVFTANQSTAGNYCVEIVGRNECCRTFQLIVLRE